MSSEGTLLYQYHTHTHTQKKSDMKNIIKCNDYLIPREKLDKNNISIFLEKSVLLVCEFLKGIIA